MAVGFTYSVEKICPICGEKIQVTKTRSRLITIKKDKDFCMHYKDFNPYYYVIWACSKCGYAADENCFEKVKEADKNTIAEFLIHKKVNIEYKEERTREEGIRAFKLAIFFADLIKERDSHMAGLYLKLGWLYREAEDRDNENAVLEQAIKHYDQSLMKERYPIGNMTDTMVTYLIGALYYRTGNVEKATQYLSRVMNDQRARIEPVYNLARDLWQDIRAEK